MSEEEKHPDEDMVTLGGEVEAGGPEIELDISSTVQSLYSLNKDCQETMGMDIFKFLEGMADGKYYGDHPRKADHLFFMISEEWVEEVRRRKEIERYSWMMSQARALMDEMGRQGIKGSEVVPSPTNPYFNCSRLWKKLIEMRNILIRENNEAINPNWLRDWKGEGYEEEDI